METIIKNVLKSKGNDHKILLVETVENLEKQGLSKEETAFVLKQLKDNDKKKTVINRYHQWIYIQLVETEKETYKVLEKCRKAGDSLLSHINDYKIESITIQDFTQTEGAALALAEGMALGNYQFLKYKKEAKDKKNSLKNILIDSKYASDKKIETLNNVIDGNLFARDLVNEPSEYLTAVQLSKEIEKLGKLSGFKTEVFNKAKIKTLKMGGLLAVSRGSTNPPTFTICEWKPKNAKNKKPYIIVGKGVVMDTGGLNIKPGANMDTMKCDMGGSAAVAGTMYAIAKEKLPVWVIGLVPATDNRPDGNAYAPGDIIKMHNGTTVEIFSTDAEGRMILGDALSYAQKYKPKFVIDLATLTGAASVAIGKLGIVAMGNDDKVMGLLKESGNNMYERIAEFPFWEEFGELIKSSVADIKNSGSKFGGAITAGKFLEHFVDYPWVHLDIAGPVFVDSKDSYRGLGGTGVGVRLLFDLFSNI